MSAARSRRSSVPATLRIRLSPAWWPSESLTRLVVDVQHEHAAGLALALDQAHLLGQVLQEAAAVVEPRERVVVGEVLELRLEALALGDVGHQPLGLVGSAVAVALHDRLVADPMDVAAAVEDAVLDLDRVARLG
jgi:hypothetical protein